MTTENAPDALALADELSRAAGWPFAAPQGALTSAAAELRRLAAEVEALRRGEFICQRCGLRKDADADGTAPF